MENNVDMAEENHYVANMEYQLLWKTRDEKKRSATDLAFLIIFGLMSVLWIGIGIYGFTNNDGIPALLTKDIEKSIHKYKIMDALSYSRGACFGFVWFAVLLIAMFFIMVRWVTKITIFATLVIAGLNIFVLSYSFLMVPSLLTFVITLFGWMVYGVTIYAFKKVGTKTTCKVLQDACKTMICFPSSLIIVLLELVIELGVIGFTAGATAYLIFIKRTDFNTENESVEVTVNPPIYVILILPIFIGSAFWIICFVGTFRRMLLHGVFAHWYRASDKKNISMTVGLRCFATAFRYHMGTLVFSSTIFAIVPIIGALLNSGRALLKLVKKRPSSLCALWFALLESLSNASIMCISYGTSLCESTKNGLKLVMRHPLKYTATTAISNWTALYALQIIPLMTLGASYLFIVTQLNGIDSQYITSYLFVPLVIIITCSAFITAILIVIFKNATEAVIVCFFEESNLSKTSFDDEDCEE